MNRTEKLGVTLLVIVTFNIFLLCVFPYMNAFDLWHMAVAEQTQREGYFNTELQTPSYYIETVTISMVSGIEYSILPLLPLQLLPLVLCSAALFRIMGPEKRWYLVLVAIYSLTISSPSRYTWFVHGLGFTMCLCTMIMALLFIRNRGVKNYLAYSVALLFLISGIVLTSYKITYLVLVFLLFGVIMLSIQARTCNVKPFRRATSFLLLTVFGAVLTLFVSRFFYDQFLPTLSLALGDGYYYSSGIEKLLFGLLSSSDNPIDIYRVSSPPEVLYLNLLWYSLVCGCFIFFLISILRQFIHRNPGSDNMLILSAFSLSSIAIFFIYQLLGHEGLEFVVFSGFLGFVAFLSSRNSGRHVRKILSMCVLALMLISVVSIAEYSTGRVSVSPRDEGEFRYLGQLSQWYEDNSHDENSIVFYTDVLTCGFLKKLDSENGVYDSDRLDVYDKDDLAFLFGANVSIEDLSVNGSEVAYIVNEREDSFMIYGWEVFISWSNFRQELSENADLDCVFDSGDIYVVYLNQIL